MGFWGASNSGGNGLMFSSIPADCQNSRGQGGDWDESKSERGGTKQQGLRSQLGRDRVYCRSGFPSSGRHNVRNHGPLAPNHVWLTFRFCPWKTGFTPTRNSPPSILYQMRAHIFPTILIGLCIRSIPSPGRMPGLRRNDI